MKQIQLQTALATSHERHIQARRMEKHTCFAQKVIVSGGLIIGHRTALLRIGDSLTANCYVTRSVMHVVCSCIYNNAM